jgi:leader peptidase (prepilin peptidase) / N-methyltransferase
MEAVRALEPLASSAGAYVMAVVLGLVWGSFANVCIYRMPPTAEHPKGRSVVSPGSHCGACGKAVRWYDNVPILSFLWLRGRCRDCKTEFSARYLLVEALTGALFGVAWWAAVDASAMFEPLELRLLRFAVYAAFVMAMVVVTFIDLDHQLILDRLTYPSIPVFYAAGLLLGNRWQDGLIGAAVGYGTVWLIIKGYHLLTGRWAMGMGDGKLLAIVGALLGWRGVVVALFGGSIVGTVITLSVLLLIRLGGAPQDEAEERAVEGKAGQATEGEPAEEEPAEEDDDGEELTGAEVPFGPYLAIAALFYLFAEPWVRINVAWLGS